MFGGVQGVFRHQSPEIGGLRSLLAGQAAGPSTWRMAQAMGDDQTAAARSVA